MSKIITFYSYKGGVGRTMAMINTAVLLSQWKYKTLIIDWDLEAPGLENFFREYVSDIEKIKQREGLMDILDSMTKVKKEEITWKDKIVPISISPDHEPLHLITAGKRDENYSKKLRNFNVGKFYDEQEGGMKIEHLREELIANYDFVLVDSRTGVTDFGGICTIHIPDILILLFTPTEQSLQGVIDIAEKAIEQQQNIPFDRQRLITAHFPTRIDAQTEFKITKKWIDRFSHSLKRFYGDWVPKGIKIKDFIELIKIPYIPFFSYGEQLPVIIQGTSDPAGLGYAYENLASLIANNFEDINLFVQRRNRYIDQAKKIQFENDLVGKKVKVFISYAWKDIKFVEKLKAHLSILRSSYNIDIWEYPQVIIGETVENIINAAMKNSDIYIFVLSVDFLSSKWAKFEMEYALKNRQGKLIIPILAKQVNLENLTLAKYQWLPANGKPISSYTNEDDAYTEILAELEKVIKRLSLEKEVEKSSIDNFRVLSFKQSSKLKKQIAKGKIGESIDILMKFVRGNDILKGKERELILISSEYNNMIDSRNKGILPYEEISIRLNMITSKLLDFIEEIEVTDHNKMPNT